MINLGNEKSMAGFLCFRCLLCALESFIKGHTLLKVIISMKFTTCTWLMQNLLNEKRTTVRVQCNNSADWEYFLIIVLSSNTEYYLSSGNVDHLGSSGSSDSSGN